ncbi:rhodanese-like domain-containing protein [Streptomyces sp. NBC_01478]|uniref:rhodanese-like domain-containing protein n=1 Tax=Streptomyces sp. NBC_01478 TaxID=2903882 RepID=UPI002E3194F1|nr:rhodanese-like domain-containing protein [Streptomyces sp. NBC_01478]
MAREVDPEAFAAALAAGGIVVDVREQSEYLVGHVPGARLMPLSALAGRIGELPAGRPVYVICASGNRSLTAADRMSGAGIDAYSVAGGTSGWARTGRPLVTGPHATVA